MGDVIDGPWNPGVDLDGDDDLLPAQAYGHEVELYEQVRHPSQPGAAAATKGQRVVYASVWHGVHVFVYAGRMIKAFFRGLPVALSGIIHFVAPWSLRVALDAAMEARSPSAIKDAFRRLGWSIAWRLAALAVAVAVPLNLLGSHFYYEGRTIGLDLGTEAALWIMGTVTAVALIIIGARRSEQPIIDGPAPRQRGDLTEDTINRALRATGILPKPKQADVRAGIKPDGVQIAMLPRHEDGGVEVVYDLPIDCGKGFEDVRKAKDRIAAAFAIPTTHLMLEPGMHAAQVRQWNANRDPFDPASAAPTPLLEEDAWSVFWGVPYGQDPRRQDLTVPIVGTHFVIGALPGAGKTMSGRDIAAGVILDPFAKLHVFDGKMGKDWKAIGPIADTYESDSIQEQCEVLRDLLVRMLEQGDAKFRAMKQMPDEDCPENKITPTMHAAGFAYQMLIIDECHRHLGDPVYGAEITDLLIKYVQGYRAIGYGLMLLTQRPDGKTSESFTKLRDVCGSRLALRVIDWRTSNMILGDQMNTRGYDASLIGQSQLGVGIFRADMDADGRTDKVAHTVRSYYMDNADWSRICQRGAALRREYAPEDIVDAEVVDIPDEKLPAKTLFERFGRYAPQVLRDNNLSDVRLLGMWLSKQGVPTEAAKVGPDRVRSRLAVEDALGLPQGCLMDAVEVAPGQPVGNPDPTFKSYQTGHDGMPYGSAD
jgi:S-DNA-T family DNA segregation ATPase FtsK/SpoIIIE